MQSLTGIRPLRSIWSLAFALSACTVGPQYRPPDGAGLLPAGYPPAQSVTSAAAQDRWWRLLGDPTLDELIARALADNPDLAVAEARVRESRALAQVAGAAFLPELSAGAGLDRNEISRHGEQLSIIPISPRETTFTDFRVGFDASWEIDVAGHTRREVEAAVARLGGAGAARDDARVVVAAEVASAYTNYRLERQRARIAAENRDLVAGICELVRLERQAGVASDLDLRRAQTDQLTSDALLPARESAWHVALYELAALTGQPQVRLGERLSTDVDLPALPVEVPAGLPSDLLRRRPDIRQAERTLAAATAEVGAAVAARFPRFTLVGDAGVESIHTGDLTSAASRFWDLQPQVNVPLFTAGRLRHEVDAAAAARESALAAYRSKVLNAVADVESALIRLSSEQTRAARLAAAREVLEGSVALARRRYEAGEAGLPEVLEAERSLNEATDRSLQSAGQVLLDFIALQKALGGGWGPIGGTS